MVRKKTTIKHIFTAKEICKKLKIDIANVKSFSTPSNQKYAGVDDKKLIITVEVVE